LERFQLKLTTKAKEAFEHINRTAQERLENDQIKVTIHFHREYISMNHFQIKSAQRHLKIANHLMSDEEKLRRRRERQVRIY
jgi:hypothetical protein